MKISKIILSLFSCALIFAVAYYVKFSVTSKDENCLIVGTSLDYPPYEFIDAKTGQAVGLDIDLVAEVASRLDKKLIIKNMPFTSLVFGLLSNDVDLIASGLSPTSRRAKLVAFSETYVQGIPFVVITNASKLKPHSMQDLQKEIVAVNTGYLADLYMGKEHPDIQLLKLDSPSDCFMALQTGVVDAFITSPYSVETFLNNISNKQDFFVMQVPNAGEACAFAVAKNNEKFLNKINQAFDSMRADGTLEKIKQAWGFE